MTARCLGLRRMPGNSDRTFQFTLSDSWSFSEATLFCQLFFFKVHFFGFIESLAAAVSSEDMAPGIEEAAKVFIPCVCGWVYPLWSLFIDTCHTEDGVKSQWMEKGLSLSCFPPRFLSCGRRNPSVIKILFVLLISAELLSLWLFLSWLLGDMSTW